MKIHIVRDVLGWGIGLWLFGYILGFVFYAFVPSAQIGWYVMPLGIAATCLVLWRKVRFDSAGEAVLLGIGWTAIAVICDYVFIIKLLNPADGYYKPDVYLYYLLTFVLPVGAALITRNCSKA